MQSGVSGVLCLMSPVTRAHRDGVQRQGTTGPLLPPEAWEGVWQRPLHHARACVVNAIHNSVMIICISFNSLCHLSSTTGPPPLPPLKAHVYCEGETYWDATLNQVRGCVLVHPCLHNPPPLSHSHPTLHPILTTSHSSPPTAFHSLHTIP